jgi:hypothetical protein
MTRGAAGDPSARRPPVFAPKLFAAISSKVQPKGFTEEADGSITVDVHQVVHDASTGDLISDSRVRHRYRLEDGLVVQMDVLDTPDQQ